MQSQATSTYAGASSNNWLEIAERLPLAFALVREDTLIDQSVLRHIGSKARIAMIASGGCTAALLASSPMVTQLTLVDTNEAQIALTRLKLHLLATEAPQQRLALLGHTFMDPDSRLRLLENALDRLGLPREVLGPSELLATSGPDYLGRYEQLFAALRGALVTHGEQLSVLLGLSDPREQERHASPGTALGAAIDEAFDDVMSLPNLVRLFGDKATSNPVEPFARHFARRTRHTLSTLPAVTNPYLWQVLAGRFAHGTLVPWLTAEPGPLPEVVYVQSTMTDALRGIDSQFDLIHLSNILDWLTPEEAIDTLEVAWRALRPGGLILIRQLNSSLTIPSLGKQFHWLAEAKQLHQGDRSFFYQDLHLGQK